MSDNRVPLSLIQRTIADIPAGGMAWAVPWALEVQLMTRRGFLNLKCMAHPAPSGTVSMQVNHDTDGWVCTLHEAYLFTPTAEPVGVLVKEIRL